jgi:hypothetical protein
MVNGNHLGEIRCGQRRLATARRQAPTTVKTSNQDSTSDWIEVGAQVSTAAAQSTTARQMAALISEARWH